MFAASWDAACELARAPLADALYEKALDGLTETITKDGEVVATRHRHDSRLSIAVLHRLDKRCAAPPKRARATSPSSSIGMSGWPSSAVARRRVRMPSSKLRRTINFINFPRAEIQQTSIWRRKKRCRKPTSPTRCWKDEDDNVWMTDFPPPPGFDGWEKCKWGGFRYERECTDEEAAVLEASAAAVEAEEREDEEKLRDFWFTTLQAGLDDDAAQPACEASPPPLR